VVKELIEEVVVSELDQLDRNGSSPLMVAAAKGEYDEAVSLLDKGADPLVTDRHGMTARTRANNKGNNKIGKLLELAETDYSEAV